MSFEDIDVGEFHPDVLRVCAERAEQIKAIARESAATFPADQALSLIEGLAEQLVADLGKVHTRIVH